MIPSTGATLTPKRNSKKNKSYSDKIERQLRLDNLRLAVEYYGKDYMRKIFKITKRRVSLP